jgi:hypothetical protein
MPTTPSFLRRIASRVSDAFRIDDAWVAEPSGPAQNPPMIMPFVREGGHWRLVSPDFNEPGTRVYRVTLGLKTVDQYLENILEYRAIQDCIDAAPMEYRQPRRRKVGGDA